MWKQIIDLGKQYLSLARRTQENEKDIKELRHGLKDVREDLKDLREEVRGLTRAIGIVRTFFCAWSCIWNEPDAACRRVTAGPAHNKKWNLKPVSDRLTFI